MSEEVVVEKIKNKEDKNNNRINLELIIESMKMNLKKPFHNTVQIILKTSLGRVQEG